MSLEPAPASRLIVRSMVGGSSGWQRDGCRPCAEFSVTSLERSFRRTWRPAMIDHRSITSRSLHPHWKLVPYLSPLPNQWSSKTVRAAEPAWTTVGITVGRRSSAPLPSMKWSWRAPLLKPPGLFLSVGACSAAMLAGPDDAYQPVILNLLLRIRRRKPPAYDPMELATLPTRARQIAPASA